MKPFVVIATETEERIDFFDTFEEAADFIATECEEPSDFVIFARSMFQVTGTEKEVITKPVISSRFPSVPKIEEIEEIRKKETEETEEERVFEILPPSVAAVTFFSVEEFTKWASNFMGGVRLTKAEKDDVLDAFKRGAKKVTLES